ncbi:CopG family antitoxin [Spirochaeta isovalerica]|uniref:Putative DNA binding CopG/RHH family protein n=1 Tax=Spirochaeta isovalerica TaxID=150 RepID=A0A841R531_9SPIO|nr:CopG family antitoxin [Spirochaeta isovalerica]MBB6480264.1 putative DNA binding CopG/RHH family protein [Spirochaeta isovalerica]
MEQLLPEELEIENDIENLGPVSAEKRNKIEGLIDAAKKNKAISLRIASYDLEKIKEKAGKEGIPYQTLINSILHKYITNQLLEKDEIIKTFSVMQKMKV